MGPCHARLIELGAGQTSFEIAKRVMSKATGTPTCNMQQIPGTKAWDGWSPGGVFLADHQNLRLWMKLFDVRPDKLPVELRTQIVSWLSAAPLQVTGMSPVSPHAPYFIGYNIILRMCGMQRMCFNRSEGSFLYGSPAGSPRRASNPLVVL